MVRVLIVAAMLFVASHSTAEAEQPSLPEFCRKLEKALVWEGRERWAAPLYQKYIDAAPAECINIKWQWTENLKVAQNTPEWKMLPPEGMAITSGYPLLAAATPKPPSFAANVVTPGGALFWPQIPVEQMIAHPTEADLDANYPPSARAQGMQAPVMLEGRALEDGLFVWRVMDIPTFAAGWGLEEAAIKVASRYRAPEKLLDGTPTKGLGFVTVVSFLAPPPKPAPYLFRGLNEGAQ